MNDMKILRDKMKNMTLLFVDDEEEVRDSTSKLFDKFFKKVILCKDGQDGLLSFKKEKHIDVIITDIVMPIMDGVTMIQKIKNIDSDVFVIFLSANRDDIDIDDTLYNSYITKPITYDNLKSIMTKISEIKC